MNVDDEASVNVEETGDTPGSADQEDQAEPAEECNGTAPALPDQHSVGSRPYIHVCRPRHKEQQHMIHRPPEETL